MSGDGAISLLIGYLAMSLVSFFFAYTEWRSNKSNNEK